MITRTLHVAAMPFPTPQGTQAAVRAMVEALGSTGHETHLLTYGEGASPASEALAREPAEGARPLPPPPFGLHRARALPGRPGLRSGPSLRKLAQDALLVPQIRRLTGRLAPTLVVAHHVEAMAACLAARARPLLFFAHTALEPELPTYGPALLRGALARAGRRADGALARRADAVACVSPALVALLAESSSVRARYVPIPWSVPPPITTAERTHARRALGLGDDDEVLLYAGNLDAYQGWELAVEAAARAHARRPRVLLLVATACEAAPLLRRASLEGMAGRVRVTALGGEAIRRQVHAAADLAVVPRRAPGGLPVKLLDAMARGVPVVACARATAGLPLGGAAMLASDDDDDALGAATLLALAAPAAAAEVGARGRAFVAAEHAPAAFVEGLARAAAGLP